MLWGISPKLSIKTLKEQSKRAYVLIYLPPTVAAYYCELLSIIDKDVVSQIPIKRDMVPATELELVPCQCR